MKRRLVGALVGFSIAAFSFSTLACNEVDLHLQTPAGVTPAAPIFFKNLSGDKVTIQWVGYDGQLRNFKELQPGEYYLQPSFENHLWVASVANSNKCLGPFEATEELNVVVIR